MRRYNVEELNKAAKEIEAAAKQYEATLSTMPYIFRDTYHLSRLQRN